ncbi:MAG TPA: tRNA preQ1(34) S-adenosylmethionine ribosyltransferase-isomerase QueA, partial [Ruminococcaceae bacterium]|nr:tRNA preQ1(34) S-adenosylmethionine ribosyltransferase-isomerase QueA [Oscillospiraceae bacterium]
MKTSDFSYDLPKELIAQTPAEPRDSSRLMVLNKKTGEIAHRHFYDIVDFLNP